MYYSYSIRLELKTITKGIQFIKIKTNLKEPKIEIISLAFQKKVIKKIKKTLVTHFRQHYPKILLHNRNLN